MHMYPISNKSLLEGDFSGTIITTVTETLNLTRQGPKLEFGWTTFRLGVQMW